MLADTLFDLQENGNYLPEINNLESLIEAVNDWPKEAADLDKYLKQIRDFLNEKVISLPVVHKARTKLNQGLWEMESFENLHRFMESNSAEKLEDVFSALKKYV